MEEDHPPVYDPLVRGELGVHPGDLVVHAEAGRGQADDLHVSHDQAEVVFDGVRVVRRVHEELVEVGRGALARTVVVVPLGEQEGGEVLENDYRFRVNWLAGQKTGFFIDQRKNRKMVGEYARGRKVLNMFGYTGGFSIYALGGGATLVHSVDSSGKAIDLCRVHAEMNFPGDPRHEAMAVDAFGFFNDMKETYDLVVLDPPAFAKHQNVLGHALQGYKRLNQRAFEHIAPGGILFTFSCSQAVSRENFRKSVFVAAANAKRNVRILHQLSQPPDHPVSLYHPEGEYLKGLVLEVE